jgi:hypothetical protein
MTISSPEKVINANVKKLFTMREMSNTSKKNRFLHGLRFVSLSESTTVEGKKGFLQFKMLRFNERSKALMVFAVIAIILVSVFAFMPKGNNSVPETLPQSTDSPTASPTITPQETNNPTTNPTVKPDVFAGMKTL